MKSRKGISPIFATLILIAIAVIAGVVVYMFTSGTLATMTGSTSAVTEKVSVQGASIVTSAVGTTGDSITVYAQSTNGLGVTVNGMLIKDTNGNTVATVTPSAGTSLSSTGALSSVTGTLTYTGTNPIVQGSIYTITLTTTKGGSFISSQVTAS